MLDLSVRLVAQGNTTAREVAAEAVELRALLDKLPGVVRTAPDWEETPEGAKGVGAALGRFLIELAPETLKQALGLLQAWLNRPGHPPMVLEIVDRKGAFRVSCDSKTSLDQLVAAVERLRGAATH